MEVPGAVRRRGPRTQGQARRQVVRRQRGGADRAGGGRRRRPAGRRHSRAAAATARAAARRACSRSRQRRRSKPERDVEPVVVAAQPDRIAQASIDDSTASRRRGNRRRRSAFEADAVMPDKVPYASPAVRLFARELGVDLAQVAGSERGGRISREDVQKFVKSALAGGSAAGGVAGAAGGGGLNLLPWPKVDFAKFGEIETQAAVAHPEVVRRQPRAQLGDDPARHPARRCRHHRTRSVARLAQRGKRKGHRQGRRRQADDARVPDQGRRRGAAEISRPSTPRSMPAART